LTKRDPINPTDDDARALAQSTLAHQGAPLILISTLSVHTKALQANPACSLLIGEPGPKGDPLTHPRMTLICKAEAADKAIHKKMWLAAIPKAKLYYDFGDFIMFRLAPTAIHLNGGFGKAYQLTPEDLV